MTVQYADLSTVSGQTLTVKVFEEGSDTEVAGNTLAVTERTNDKGTYRVSVTRSGVLTGTYKITLFSGAIPLASGLRVFAGVDAEIGKSISQSIKTDTGTTIPGLVSTLTTKIRKFFQLALRKDAGIGTDNATEVAEINADGGNGTGAYLNTTDALEAIRDRGDSGAWGGTSSDVLITTTIATVTSPTVLVLTSGSPDNDVYNDQLAIITDAATSTQKAVSIVLDYIGSSKTLTLLSTPGFTVASGDTISIVAVAGLNASQRAQLGLIGAGTRVTVKADSGTSITLKIGDTYDESRNTARRIEVNDGDSSIYDLLMDGDVSAIAFGLGDAAGNKDIVVGTVSPDTVIYTAASGSVSAYTTVFVELTVADTAKPVCGTYDIQVTFSDGKKKTAFSGSCELVKDNKS